MKKFFLILILFISLGIFCDDNRSSSSDDSSPVVDSTKTAHLERVFLVMNFIVYDTDGKKYFAAPERVDGVEIKIDNITWGYYQENNLEIPATDAVLSNYRVKNSEMSYFAETIFEFKYENLKTAGDFAKILNSNVEPGEHVCEIYKITVKNVNNQSVEIKPNIMRKFILNTVDKSITFDDIEIELK